MLINRFVLLLCAIVGPDFARAEQPKDVRLNDWATLNFGESGATGVDRNSQPFLVGENKIMIVGFIPTGNSPYVHVSLDQLDESDFISGSVSDSTIEAAGPKVVAKMHYKTGAGKCYAEVATQNCQWLVAVVTVTKHPTEKEIEEVARLVLREAKWPATLRVLQ